ncbi:FtsX-like permease family protein [Actinoplanes missouriensis]|uniref:FtsX-like permease family protein n=1 Tax=Actinoplanes missouriensis TaxID=1866 RepID=UPI0033DB4D7C
MIALVLTMVWARRGQAVVLALLTALAVAPAVAAPAYVRAADRVVAAGEVAAADLPERTVTIGFTENAGQIGDPATDGGGQVNLSSTGGALVGLPGFDYVYAAEYPTVGIERDDRYRTRMVYRQDACAHLRMVTGRCLIGAGDVVLGEQTAARLGLAAGDSIALSSAVFVADPEFQMYVADGAPKRLFVSGIYTVPEPTGLYWGRQGYFAADPGDRAGEPAFVGLGTMSTMQRRNVQVTIDGSAGPGAMDVDRLPAVRAALDQLHRDVADLGGGLTLTTAMPALMHRIDTGRDAVRAMVPVPALALILLACLTLFLVVGYGAEARRPEAAVIALRGARWWHRWWLATGESLVAVLAGALAGVVGGQLLVTAAVAVRYPGVGADPDPASLTYAPLALAAAALTVVLAQRRPLLRPVATLLRRAPRPGRTAGLLTDVLVTALAAAAVAQLFTGGGVAGAGAAAPALVMVAGALLVARALGPLVARFGRRSIARGRLGSGLAGYQLSRQPRSATVFAVLVASVAVSGYAACAADVASRGRQLQAGLGTGADRVLTVAPIGRTRLMNAVRAVDPDGARAMAVVPIVTPESERPALAVDTTRLAVVAAWPSGSDPARVAASLRPPAPDPVVLRGADVVLDLTAAEFRAGKAVSLDVVLTPLGGEPDIVTPMGVLRDGRHTYRQRLPQCAAGCRLNALKIAGGSAVLDVTGVITLHGPAAAGGDPARWRSSPGGELSAGPDGLRIALTGLEGLPEGVIVQPVSTPYPLPVAIAGGGRPGTITGLDYRNVPITVAARLPALPSAGSPAVLVDLEYADRLAADGAAATGAQVWLSASAPDDIAARLSDQGVKVVGDVRAEQLARRLDRQGPAVAIGYFVLVAVLVAGLAAGVLVLTAAVDRQRRAEDLAALRVQGLGRGEARGAVLWAYPWMVVLAVVAGTAVALGGWALTGWALPLAGLEPPPLPFPGRPGVAPLALTAGALLIVLLGAAIPAARGVLRRLR